MMWWLVVIALGALLVGRQWWHRARARGDGLSRLDLLRRVVPPRRRR